MLLDFLQTTVNRLLAMDPDAEARLAGLNGKVIGVELTQPEKSLAIEILDGRFWLSESPAEYADVALKGSLPAFSAAARSGEFNHIQITGDVETAQSFAHALQNMDIDWEEQAAHIIGDFPAHQLSRAVRAASDWANQARTSVARNLGEYLVEERRDLAPADVVERFLSDVDDLRADTDRLELRIQRLEQALADEE